MLFTVIIININILVWTLPPFRQYKSKYFYYFYILAISDPLTLFMGHNFHWLPAKTFIIISILSLLSVIIEKGTVKNYLLIFFSLLIITFLSIKLPINYLWFIMSLIHLAIFIVFAKRTMVFFQENHSILFFHLALLLYEASLIAKFLFIMIDIKTGLLFFYLTTAFEILLAIYFMFDREDKQQLVVKVKSLE